METYIGIAAGNKFYPQYSMQGGEKLQQLVDQPSFPIDQTYPEPSIAKAEIDGSGRTTCVPFPAANDAWRAVVLQTLGIDALLSAGGTDAIAFAKCYPPVGAEIYIFQNNKNLLYGPVCITGYEFTTKNGIKTKHLLFSKLPSSCYREPKMVQFTVANSSTRKEFHLRIARADVQPSGHNDSERMALRLMQPMPLYMVNLLFGKLPLPDICCKEDDTPETQARQALGFALQIAYIRRSLLVAKHGLLRDPALADFVEKNMEAKLEPIEAFCRHFDDMPLKVRCEHLYNIKALLNTSEFLHCQDESQLYEYYCLIRLIELLKSLDFKPSQSLPPLRYSEYGNIKGSAALRNTFFFQRGDNVDLTLYREPRIYDDRTENGLLLYQRDTKSINGCTPDFVLKISTKKGKKAAYVILDAKYTCHETIKEFSLPDIVEKYYLRLGTERKNDTIAMVWTLQGRANSANSESYAGTQPSPMEQKLGHFPSFGNCLVNESDSGNMDSFRATLQKLLPPPTPDSVP